jgi:hypothetical protein
MRFGTPENVRLARSLSFISMAREEIRTHIEDLYAAIVEGLKVSLQMEEVEYPITWELEDEHLIGTSPIHIFNDVELSQKQDEFILTIEELLKGEHFSFCDKVAGSEESGPRHEHTIDLHKDSVVFLRQKLGQVYAQRLAVLEGSREAESPAYSMALNGVRAREVVELAETHGCVKETLAAMLNETISPETFTAMLTSAAERATARSGNRANYPGGR